MLRTPIYFHVNIILDFTVKNRNVSVLCQSECVCLHTRINIVVFFVKVIKKLAKRESTRANVQSCPYNEHR